MFSGSQAFSLPVASSAYYHLPSSVFLKMWPWGQKLFLILGCYLLSFFFFLLFILSMVYGRIFQRLCDMWWWNVRVHWCFKMLSVWISSMVNTDEYNPQKQSSWRSLIVQKSVREFWGQGVRELLVHCQSEHLCPRVQVQACSCGSWLLCIVSWRDLSPFHNESFYCTGPFS